MHVVSEIMNVNPIYCTPDTRIAEIKHLLKKYQTTEIFVLDSDKEKHPLGMITMEDVTSSAVEHNDQPSDVSAVECMRSIPAVVHEGSSFEECLNVMRNNHMESIPVVDLNGHVAGVIERSELTKILM